MKRKPEKEIVQATPNGAACRGFLRRAAFSGRQPLPAPCRESPTRQTASRLRAMRAFTLTEVVIATFILSMGVVAVVGFLGWLIRSNIFTRGTAAATLYGQQAVERALTSEYQDMTCGHDRVSGYDRDWVIVSSNGMKSVVVTVSWKNLDGRTHSLVVRSGLAP